MRVARYRLTVPEAEAIVGGPLGRPSKMPCVAWGISADECPLGSLLREKPGSVCSACYAQRGHYVGGSVETAHERRLEALSHPRWSEAMAVLVGAFAGGGYFRWFDSGDIQGPEHFDQILTVAKRTPSVRHWLPTRETEVVSLFLPKIPKNLTVRISAEMIGENVQEPTWGLPTSTVHREVGAPVPSISGLRRDSIECPAPWRGHTCGNCRACWSPRVRNVSYLLNAGIRGIARETRRLSLPVVP